MVSGPLFNGIVYDLSVCLLYVEPFRGGDEEATWNHHSDTSPFMTVALLLLPRFLDQITFYFMVTLGNHFFWSIQFPDHNQNQPQLVLAASARVELQITCRHFRLTALNWSKRRGGVCWNEISQGVLWFLIDCFWLLAICPTFQLAIPFEVHLPIAGRYPAHTLYFHSFNLMALQ